VDCIKSGHQRTPRNRKKTVHEGKEIIFIEIYIQATELDNIKKLYLVKSKMLWGNWK